MKSMTEAEALAAIRAWTAKGWTFVLRAREGGWTCNAVGAGLARADCDGAKFEDAVALALHHACAMEDDPWKVLAKYRLDLEREVRAAFGAAAKFRFEIGESGYDDDAKRIHLIVLCDTDSGTHVVRESLFYSRFLVTAPHELRESIVLTTEHPAEPMEESAA